MLIVLITTMLGLLSSSATAQNATDNSWCDTKWLNSKNFAPYQEFMEKCHRLVQGEQLNPTEWQEWQRWQQTVRKVVTASTNQLGEFRYHPPQQPLRQQPAPSQVQRYETDYEAMERIFGKDNTKVAWMRFHGHTAEMIDWLNAQRNTEADRKYGNSYSIRAR